MGTLPVTAELFHAEDQRDMTNIIAAFCNLRTRLKNNFPHFRSRKVLNFSYTPAKRVSINDTTRGKPSNPHEPWVILLEEISEMRKSLLTFPWQSRDRIPKQFLKLISCFSNGETK
jgi:hypothetical protein